MYVICFYDESLDWSCSLHLPGRRMRFCVLPFAFANLVFISVEKWIVFFLLE